MWVQEIEEEWKEDKMKRDYEKREWFVGTLRTSIVNNKHCRGEMYRQSWMMEEGEDCLWRGSFRRK